MSLDISPFLGEIGIASFNFPPKGWARCNGQLLPINQNQALFSLLGTGYGGNGQTTFALPDLRGRVPIHAGNGYDLYQKGGQEAHTVILSEMPQHVHSAQGTSAPADAITPQANLLAAVDPTALTTSLYAPPANFVSMAAASITNTGGSQPHLNLQPYLVLNFCISLQGIFPARD